MKAAIVALAALSFLLGSWLGGTLARTRDQTKLKKARAGLESDNALSCTIVLSELREGRSSNGIEYLEFSTDCLVTRLHSKLSSVDGTTRSRIMKTLEGIREYREKWPRQVHPEILANDQVPSSEILETAEEARKILTGISEKESQ